MSSGSVAPSTDPQSDLFTRIFPGFAALSSGCASHRSTHTSPTGATTITLSEIDRFYVDINMAHLQDVAPQVSSYCDVLDKVRCPSDHAPIVCHLHPFLKKNEIKVGIPRWVPGCPDFSPLAKNIFHGLIGCAASSEGNH